MGRVRRMGQWIQKIAMSEVFTKCQCQLLVRKALCHASLSANYCSRHGVENGSGKLPSEAPNAICKARSCLTRPTGPMRPICRLQSAKRTTNHHNQTRKEDNMKLKIDWLGMIKAVAGRHGRLSQTRSGNSSPDALSAASGRTSSRRRSLTPRTEKS